MSVPALWQYIKDNKSTFMETEALGYYCEKAIIAKKKVLRIFDFGYQCER
jgi:hypothetical protein